MSDTIQTLRGYLAKSILLLGYNLIFLNKYDILCEVYRDTPKDRQEQIRTALQDAKTMLATEECQIILQNNQASIYILQADLQNNTDMGSALYAALHLLEELTDMTYNTTSHFSSASAMAIRSLEGAYSAVVSSLNLDVFTSPSIVVATIQNKFTDTTWLTCADILLQNLYCQLYNFDSPPADAVPKITALSQTITRVLDSSIDSRIRLMFWEQLIHTAKQCLDSGGLQQ